LATFKILDFSGAVLANFPIAVTFCFFLVAAKRKKNNWLTANKVKRTKLKTSNFIKP